MTDTDPTTHRFVPICIRTRVGYYAGPIYWAKTDWTWLDRPIILDTRKRQHDEEREETTP